jgi:hypothetical protein
MTKTPDFPVGYKNPPKHSRFKPGQSGNPKGRPKKLSVGFELVAELNRRVTIRENGTELKTSKAAALAKSLVARALSGDMRAIGHLIRLLPAQFKAPTDTVDAEMSALEATALARYVERRLSVINESPISEQKLNNNQE